MDILKLISKKDLLDFSQNLSIRRNYLGDTIFPDQKTENMSAEFYRLSDPVQLPTMALVHALDTEANIGTRPTMEKVEVEKLLIKEKINTSERVESYLNRGASQNSIVAYCFDDMARLAESVKTRTEVAKMELLQSGKITVKENKLNFTVNYNVPSSNFKTLTWDSETADILGDIQELVDAAKENGQTVTKVVTSTKILTAMRKNKGIQTAVLGTLGQGQFLTLDQINTLMNSMFGFTIVTNDERYKYVKANGTTAAKRYIDDNKFIMLCLSMYNNTFGVGLWGVTPEEREMSAWTAKSMQQYITITQWKEQDPVATWTKASGLFIPVLPNPAGLFVATITL